MFKDIDKISPWARGAAERVVAAGLMRGDAEGTFRPKDPVTREELAVILDREMLLEQEIEDEDRLRLFRAVADSVIEVHAGGALGAGVLIDAANAYALTNAHVVGDCQTVEVVWPSEYASENLPHHVGPMADVVAVDQEQDLALLRIRWAGLPAKAAVIATDWTDDDLTNRNHIGRRLYIEGSPLGFSGRLSEAIFNGIRYVGALTYLDLEGHINPGNSGGPIYNVNGQLVGLVCAKLVGAEQQIEGFGLGIPLSRILPFLQTHGVTV